MRLHHSYTSYPDSRLATMFDRICHSPERMFLWVASMLYCSYVVACSNYIFADTSRVINGIFLIIFAGFTLLVPFSGLLCDKLNLSRKLALWDMQRQFTGKPGKKFWAVISVVLVLLLLPGMAAMTCWILDSGRIAAYNETMQPLNTPDQVAVTGSNVVTFVTDTKQYCDDYIPESLLAQTPEDARYILRCTNGEELYGIYERSSVCGYLRTCYMELFDRATGEIVAAETFTGSTPPISIESDTKVDQYGSYPDEEPIMAWLTDALNA